MLDPKADVTFKKIFGQNKDILKSFLNSVLPLPSQIVEIEYLSTEQPNVSPELKYGIVDVKCKDQKGKIFIVEMQMAWNKSYLDRILFGASAAYQQQLMLGGEYSSLKTVYHLSILNDTFTKDDPDWFHHLTINKEKNSKIKIKGLEFFLVELPKFIKDINQINNQEGLLWLEFLKEAG